MKKYIMVIASTILAILVLQAFTNKKQRISNQLETSSTIKNTNTINKQKIQVAILLDVSNSMDGLIEQAKAQLWNMVNTLGKANCVDGTVPKIEIALYEYGRTNNDAKKGYVKLINDFSNDLDSISQNLFTLTTSGGEEYCGHAIYSAINELNWADNADNYKVIFIAGNESFLQGDISFTKACTLAKTKGVLVNTIYCGDKISGIREHWNLGATCGSGSYTNINTNAKVDDVPTPYDSLLYVLNSELNNTYISYGQGGSASKNKQIQMDEAVIVGNKTASLKRIKAKANASVYSNAQWDLVDAQKQDSSVIWKINKAYLPDSIKNKSEKELEYFIQTKAIERAALQSKIAINNAQRDAFIKQQKLKNTVNQQPTESLETAVESIIKQQAKQFNITIKIN